MTEKILLIISLLFCTNVLAEDSLIPRAWLDALKQEAKANHISAETIRQTFKEAKYLPSVITFDRAQPEFISTFSAYVDRRVNPSSIAAGRAMLKAHDALLSRVEARYGVPKNILVAFWGLETYYGSNKGSFALPSALMTLAYEGRRAAFFRNQFMDAMRVVDAGYSTVTGLRGSWAGAMGHLQFMPSTMMKYAVDADNDGRVNVVSSLPDAFASAANYLSSIGWRKHEPVALEVKLPDSFEYSQAQLYSRKNTTEWTKLGVVQIDGTSLPVLENSAILLPQGWRGPAFVVANNFDVVMDWNRSVNYALAVGHLANQLLADKPILGGIEAENIPLTFNQTWALQARLNELGFDSGKPDGFPGAKTQGAIRQYQATQNLPQDGFASYSLYERLLQP